MRVLGIDEGFFFAKFIYDEPGVVINIQDEGFCDMEAMKEALRMFVLLGGYRTSPPPFWTIISKDMSIMARFVASRNRITAAIVFQLYAWMTGNTLQLDFDTPRVVGDDYYIDSKNLYVTDKKRKTIYDRAIVYSEDVMRRVFLRMPYDDVIKGKDGLYRLIAYMMFTNMRIKSFYGDCEMRLSSTGVLKR